MSSVPPFYVFVLFAAIPAAVLAIAAFFLFARLRAQRRPFNFSLLELFTASVGMFPVVAFIALFVIESQNERRSINIGLTMTVVFGFCAILGMIVAKLLYELRRKSPDSRPKMAALAVILGAIVGLPFGMIGLYIFSRVFMN